MRLASIVGVLALVAGLLIGSPVSAQPSDWVEYADAQRGFTLRYPPQWSPVNVGVLAAFAVAEPETAGQFRKNVVVGNSAVVPEGTTVEQVQDQEDAVARGALAGYTIVKREPVEVGPLAGIVVHYTWTLAPGARPYQMRLLLVAGGRAHGLVGTTLADSQTLDADLALLLSIMTTYRLTPSP